MLTLQSFTERLGRGEYASRSRAQSGVNRSLMTPGDKARALVLIQGRYSKGNGAPHKPPAWARSTEPPARQKPGPKPGAKRRARPAASAPLPPRVQAAAQRLVDAADMRAASDEGLPPVLRDASPMALRMMQGIDAATRAIEAAREVFETLQTAGKADPRFMPDALRAAAVLVQLVERLAPPVAPRREHDDA